MRRAINKRSGSERRYAAFYNRQEIALYAPSPWKAHVLAKRYFKVECDYYVSIMAQPTKAEQRADAKAAKLRENYRLQKINRERNLLSGQIQYSYQSDKVNG